MKRRFAALVLTTVLILGHSAPALAASRDTTSRDRTVHDVVLAVVKHLKNIFGISSDDDWPTPPKP